MLRESELDHIADRLAHRLTAHIRATLQKEIQHMTDIVETLSAQVDATLAEIASLVTEVQKDVALLSAIPKDNTAAIDAQIARLKVGSEAAANALANLRPTATAAAAAAASAAPAEAASAPAAAAPALESLSEAHASEPAAAPAEAAPAAPVEAAPAATA